MAQVAAQAEPRVRPESRPRVQQRPRPSVAARPRFVPRSRPRVAAGLLWIFTLAALLAGIVALNVSALRLGIESQQLDGRAQQLRANNEDLASELSSAGAAGRVQTFAIHRLGLVAPAATSYVRLPPPKR